MHLDAAAPAVVIGLDGEWDIARRGELRNRVEAAIEKAGGSGHLVIDMTATRFVDSITLSVLLGAQRQLRRSGGRMTTVCTDGSFVLRTLRTAGLESALGVEVRGEATPTT